MTANTARRTPRAPRLRQVALVARELEPAAEHLRKTLDLGEPFRDSMVHEFGLENAVFSAGDTFLEIVSPAQADTTAGRYLERLGGDGGYMAIFQVADTPAARACAARLGVRIVWQTDLDDISGTHFHPKDLAGAIVSVDTPKPPDAWRWGGPEWTGGAPAHDGAVIAGIVVECDDPDDTARLWGGLLDLESDRRSLKLDGGAQEVVFREGDKGIVEVTLSELTKPQFLCGVTFRGRT